MPQRGNHSSSALKEVLLYPVGKRRHRVVEKPAKCNRSIKDKTIQIRPSSISSFVDQAVIDLEQFVAQAVDTESNVVSARQCLGTARAFPLSAYDAVYLDLARSQRLMLATLDDRLRAAATEAGVSLLR